MALLKLKISVFRFSTFHALSIKYPAASSGALNVYCAFHFSEFLTADLSQKNRGKRLIGSSQGGVAFYIDPISFLRRNMAA